MSDLNVEKSIFVINKSDLGKKKGKDLDKYKPILISIKDETNIDELIDRIKKNLTNKFISVEDTLITRERHRQHLEQCILHLDEFSKKEKDSDTVAIRCLGSKNQDFKLFRDFLEEIKSETKPPDLV